MTLPSDLPFHPLGFALATLYTLGWIPLFVIRPESMRDSLPQYRPAERFAVVAATLSMSLHVTLSCVSAAFGLPAMFAVPAIFGGPAGFGQGSPPVTLVPALLSATFFLAAIAFWIWARRRIGPILVRRVPEEAPLELQQTGPFGIVRNPLYLGALLAAAAPLIAMPRPLLLFTFGLCLLALATRAYQDEQRMLAQLGEPYAAYCRKVTKRLIPFVW